MIEPTMNATPARKNSRATTRPAAVTLRTKPVSEIAFGVSRDSIRRSRTISWVVGRLGSPPDRRPRGRGGLVLVSAIRGARGDYRHYDAQRNDATRSTTAGSSRQGQWP